MEFLTSRRFLSPLTDLADRPAWIVMPPPLTAR